ncbi:MULTISPECIES: FliH/SctL family protein [Pseudomonas]|uniref:FliH/SctL family protein n=1 Tax=Pseudomonas machongensis TaxID=3110229 RepID=A0ABU5VM38_9PSED|nr:MULTISPECIES: FliH/SctL family protein [Pseudomonas]KAB5627388.1 HrpE/YscL family type III secretion apparatus protein [Pseudomonas putida]MBK0060213.1 HrpE/YscL family type III secretion apparatus protein [Pseudomonas sp. S44]MEA5674439.1 FliH/SctL family protein [Pseudomonas sp. MH2]OCT24887.1 type III secretion protein [Pseudomonas putida]OCT28876.1 type III secretion protein [Pseudomonas putida]
MSQLPSRPASRILRAAEVQAWTDGRDYLQAARDEAERIREDSARWLEQARADGFELGRAKGAEAVSELLADTAAKVEAYLAGLENSLADLALGIAREVLESLGDAERIVLCTRKALVAFRQDQALTLFVPRLEVEAVRRRMHGETDGLAAIAVESDDQLQPGQARLSSPVGSVELGLDAQLQALRRSLLPFAEVTP